MLQQLKFLRSKINSIPSSDITNLKKNLQNFVLQIKPKNVSLAF